MLQEQIIDEIKQIPSDKLIQAERGLQPRS